ncbi:MAG: PorT family protein [Prevotellaceae bacterium]|nr:PorT family protein [Prevotellaceae bacterium]
MKKALLAAIVLLLGAASARALDHEPEEGLSWQAQFGMNVSKIHGYFDIIDGTSFKMNNKAGVDIAIKGEYYLPDAHGTYISLGLEWTQKGGKRKGLEYPSRFDDEEDNVPYPGTHKVTEHYISIPIHVGFRYNFSDDWGIFGEFGPYFAIGVAGHNRFDTEREGYPANTANFKYATFKENGDADMACWGFQRFDTGIGFRVGAEYLKHYSVNVGCDWGLTDMLRGEYRDAFGTEYQYNADKLKNFCISITLGYRF